MSRISVDPRDPCASEETGVYPVAWRPMAEFVTLDLPEGDAARGVAVLRIARPPMNQLNVQLVRELAAATEEVAEHASVAALVVYGDERVFSAGDDLAELSALGAD